jgi:hypothetical protein
MSESIWAVAATKRAVHLIRYASTFSGAALAMQEHTASRLSGKEFAV